MIIKAASAAAVSSKNIIAHVHKNYADNVAKVSSSWKGGISEAYKNFNRNVKSGMTSTLYKYGSLGSMLDSLEKSIKRAEEDEARRAAMRR